MHNKFCGYTAAEGYGEAWFGGNGWNGENWRDCELRMVINCKPCHRRLASARMSVPAGKPGILIRWQQRALHMRCM